MGNTSGKEPRQIIEMTRKWGDKGVNQGDGSGIRQGKTNVGNNLEEESWKMHIIKEK